MNKLIENIDFLSPTDAVAKDSIRISLDQNTGKSRKLYIESYGCQMNFSDSEIVASLLQKEGFDPTSDINQDDIVFLNTFSIRYKS